MAAEFNLFPELSYCTSKLRSCLQEGEIFFVFENFQNNVNFSAVSNQKTLTFYVHMNSNSDVNFSYGSPCLKYFI